MIALPTIKEKVDYLIQSKIYNFCDIDFGLFDRDLVRIYDKVDGVCIYSDKINNPIPDEFKNKTYKKEELIRLPEEDGVFAVCFYLEAPDKIEGPISTGPKFI